MISPTPAPRIRFPYCARAPFLWKSGRTRLVTVPIALSFFMSGRWGAGVFLTVVAVVIGILDNILRPLLVGQGLETHPIWLLLSILGGLAVFGGMGLIYGPMVLVLLGTFIRLFVREEREESQVVLTSVVAAPTQPPAS